MNEDRFDEKREIISHLNSRLETLQTEMFDLKTKFNLETLKFKIKIDTAKFALRKISDVTSGYEMREYEMRDYAKLMLEKLDEI